MAKGLDEIDRRILRNLQADGRMSNNDLASQVGLSPTPCLRRVRQLENEGYIARYVALLDPTALGLKVSVFVRVRLTQQSDHILAAFETAIAEMPEIMECYLMTGDSDYQLRILVSSLDEFEEFLRLKLTRINGVAHITSSFSLRPIVYRTALAL